MISTLIKLLVFFFLCGLMASCCREATEWNVKRWEKKHKFEKRSYKGLKEVKRGNTIRYKNIKA